MEMTDQSDRNPRKTIFQLTLVIGIVLILSFIITIVVSGQYDGLSIVLARPSEGETYYAGPTSLLYRVPITGWVYSDKYDPTEIAVELKIYSGKTLIDTFRSRPLPDGSFIFYVTVNPDGSDGQFPAEHATCADQCHLPGEINLQPGRLLLSITATDPDGNQTTKDRNIVVDLSRIIRVPVEVVLADDPNERVEGVNIIAATWVYMWRSRYGRGETDSSGISNVPVEALSQAPTQYIFRIEPTIVDGVLYQSDEFAEVILPPAATSNPQITLRVTRHKGNLRGRLIPSDMASVASIPIWAMRVPETEVFHTLTSDEGEFVFSGLPLGEYILAVNNDSFVESGFYYADQMVVLHDGDETHVAFPYRILQGRLLNGMVRDESDNLLPFAWVSITRTGATTEVYPHTGNFTLVDLPSDEIRLSVRAPGYYSQTNVLDLSSASLDTIEITLKRQEDTTSIPWGDGEIIIPVETQYRDVDQRFVIDRGWIWGWGGEIHPTIFQVGEASVLISDGVFALEYLPGKRALLYVISGQADIRDPNRLEPIPVYSNQMVNLIGEGRLKPIQIHPFFIDHLRSGSESPLPFVWEPTIDAIIYGRLIQIGAGAAQALTLITYILVALSLVSAPFFALYWGIKLKNNRKSRS